MITFTTEQLQSLMTVAKDLKGQQPENIPANEYLQVVLMEKINNISQTEAAEIIDKMEKAIQDYNYNFNRGIEQGSVPAEDMLKNAIACNNLTDEQAITFLAATIILVKNYGNDSSVLTDEELKIQTEAIINGREVNDTTVQALIKEAAEVINTSNVLAIDSNTAASLATNPLDANTISSIREQASSPLYISVAAYIASTKDELQVSEYECTPESIATGVTAGLKMLELNADLSEGKIDLPTWLRYTKIAIGVVLSIALVVLTLPLLASFAINAMLGGILMFGSLTVAVWVSALLTVGALVTGSSLVYNKREQIISLYNTLFDKATNWIMGLKAKELVVKYYNKVVAKIKEYIQKIKKLNDKTVDQQTSPDNIEVEVAATTTTRPIVTI